MMIFSDSPLASIKKNIEIQILKRKHVTFFKNCVYFRHRIRNLKIISI